MLFVLPNTIKMFNKWISCEFTWPKFTDKIHVKLGFTCLIAGIRLYSDQCLEV